TEDEDLLRLLTAGDPLGARIVVTSFDYGNRAALRLEALPTA
ncbi:MAG: hypothetical protein JWR37_212, partial [Mycobacterium sp.]|nr:hypothetical protein [Mycobacterium sp.]